MYTLLLASQSPRRADLLRSINVSFVQQSVDIDETPLTNEAPLHYLERIVQAKYRAAHEVYGEFYSHILTADTSVICDEHILGKPANQQQAAEYLNLLSNRTHSVKTGICINGEIRIVSSTVEFRALSKDEIEAYWHSGEPQGKAGAYAIQGIGSTFIKSIQGSHSGIVGLPLYETAELLKGHGFTIL